MHLFFHPPNINRAAWRQLRFPTDRFPEADQNHSLNSSERTTLSLLMEWKDSVTQTDRAMCSSRSRSPVAPSSRPSSPPPFEIKMPAVQSLVDGPALEFPDVGSTNLISDASTPRLPIGGRRVRGRRPVSPPAGRTPKTQPQDSRYSQPTRPFGTPRQQARFRSIKRLFRRARHFRQPQKAIPTRDVKSLVIPVQIWRSPPSRQLTSPLFKGNSARSPPEFGQDSRLPESPRSEATHKSSI